MTSDKIVRRIEELETQAAFQDELHERLNDIVARQDREILQLKDRLRDLAERLQDLRDSSPVAADTGDEVPPHY